MPYVQAVVFTTWRQEPEGAFYPDAIADVYTWATANDEILPGGTPGVGPFGRYEDITGQLTPALLEGKVFAALLVITVATAQHFADDARFWTLGRRIFNDEIPPQVTNSNWDQALTAAERTQALDWLEAHGYTRAQVAARFEATDTRKQILDKLLAMFNE